MKKIIILYFAFALAVFGHDVKTLMVTNGNVLPPSATNLFDANIGPLTNALIRAGFSGGGGAGATNAIGRTNGTGYNTRLSTPVTTNLTEAADLTLSSSSGVILGSDGNFLSLAGNFDENDDNILLTNEVWGQAIFMGGNGRGIPGTGGGDITISTPGYGELNGQVVFANTTPSYTQSTSGGAATGFMLYGNGGGPGIQEVVDIEPDNFTSFDVQDWLVITGTSNLYDARFTAEGGLILPAIFWNTTNVSGKASYAADFSDRRILCNPSAASCQITLPPVGLTAPIIPVAGNAAGGWLSWTKGNANVISGRGNSALFGTVDFVVENLGSNTANTVSVVVSGHPFMTNCGLTNLVIPNQTSAHFSTDGNSNILVELVPMSLSPPTVTAQTFTLTGTNTLTAMNIFQGFWNQVYNVAMVAFQPVATNQSGVLDVIASGFNNGAWADIGGWANSLATDGNWATLYGNSNYGGIHYKGLGASNGGPFLIQGTSNLFASGAIRQSVGVFQLPTASDHSLAVSPFTDGVDGISAYNRSRNGSAFTRIGFGSNDTGGVLDWFDTNWSGAWPNQAGTVRISSGTQATNMLMFESAGANVPVGIFAGGKTLGNLAVYAFSNVNGIYVTIGGSNSTPTIPLTVDTFNNQSLGFYSDAKGNSWVAAYPSNNPASASGFVFRGTNLMVTNPVTGNVDFQITNGVVVGNGASLSNLQSTNIVGTLTNPIVSPSVAAATLLTVASNSVSTNSFTFNGVTYTAVQQIGRRAITTNWLNSPVDNGVCEWEVDNTGTNYRSYTYVTNGTILGTGSAIIWSNNFSNLPSNQTNTINVMLSYLESSTNSTAYYAKSFLYRYLYTGSGTPTLVASQLGTYLNTTTGLTGASIGAGTSYLLFTGAAASGAGTNYVFNGQVTVQITQNP